MTARNQAPALWLILHLGCVLVGLALAALLIPLPEVVAALATLMFAILILLGLVLLAVAVWRLSGMLEAADAPGRWILLLALVLAGTGLWFGAQLIRPEDSGPLALVGLVLGLGIALGTTLAWAMNTLVKIIASRRSSLPTGPSGPVRR